MRNVVAFIAFALVSFVADAKEYLPPDFLFDVRAGDSFEKIKAQQGWYVCGQKPQDLCFDGATALGETGRFVVRFINNRAFSAELEISGIAAFRRMIDRLPRWRGGDHTLVDIVTKNTEIDVIKATHDLGSQEAINRFSRYLTGDDNHLLNSISFVPLTPPAERQYPDAKTYLNDLPRGGVVMRLWKLDGPAYGPNLVILSMSLPLADKKALFPEFCDATCTSWSVPTPKESWSWKSLFSLFR